MEKCGGIGRGGDINGVRQNMNKFGAEQVINAKYGGSMCLHHAALYGYTNIVDLLIENGADLDPKSRTGETPLREAIKWRKYSTITTLIKHGADLEKAKVARWGQSWFDWSMEQEETKAAIAEGQRLAG